MDLDRRTRTAFERLKKAVIRAPVLRYLDETEPTEGQGDVDLGKVVNP